MCTPCCQLPPRVRSEQGRAVRRRVAAQPPLHVACTPYPNPLDCRTPAAADLQLQLRIPVLAGPGRPLPAPAARPHEPRRRRPQCGRPQGRGGGRVPRHRAARHRAGRADHAPVRRRAPQCMRVALRTQSLLQQVLHTRNLCHTDSRQRCQAKAGMKAGSGRSSSREVATCSTPSRYLTAARLSRAQSAMHRPAKQASPQRRTPRRAPGSRLCSPYPNPTHRAGLPAAASLCGARAPGTHTRCSGPTTASPTTSSRSAWTRPRARRSTCRRPTSRRAPRPCILPALTEALTEACCPCMCWCARLSLCSCLAACWKWTRGMHPAHLPACLHC